MCFEAQDLNGEWYREVAAAVQNAIQYCRVIYEEREKKKKKKSYKLDITGLFFHGTR